MITINNMNQHTANQILMHGMFGAPEVRKAPRTFKQADIDAAVNAALANAARAIRNEGKATAGWAQPMNQAAAMVERFKV